MKGVNINLFWLPKEVVYYVVIPMVVIVLIYIIFSLVYRKKKDTYYYNYVVDYVYSTLGIVFCSLLFCLLLGYSIATIQLLIVNRVVYNYIILVIILGILPVIPALFLFRVIKIYIDNLKHKELLDNNLEKHESRNNIQDNQVTINSNQNNTQYEDVELVKKNG